MVESVLLVMGVCDSAEAAAVSGDLGPSPSKRVGNFEQTGLWVRPSCPACLQSAADWQVRQLMKLQGLLFAQSSNTFTSLLCCLGGTILACKVCYGSNLS